MASPFDDLRMATTRPAWMARPCLPTPLDLPSATLSVSPTQMAQLSWGTDAAVAALAAEEMQETPAGSTCLLFSLAIASQLPKRPRRSAAAADAADEAPAAEESHEPAPEISPAPKRPRQMTDELAPVPQEASKAPAAERPLQMTDAAATDETTAASAAATDETTAAAAFKAPVAKQAPAVGRADACGLHEPEPAASAAATDETTAAADFKAPVAKQAPAVAEQMPAADGDPSLLVLPDMPTLPEFGYMPAEPTPEDAAQLSTSDMEEILVEWAQRSASQIDQEPSLNQLTYDKIHENIMKSCAGRRTKGGLRVSAHVVFRPKIGLCFELKSKAGTENGKQLGSSRVRPLPGPDPEAYYPKTVALWMVVLPFLLTTAVALNANQETLATWFLSTKKALAVKVAWPKTATATTPPPTVT